MENKNNIWYINEILNQILNFIPWICIYKLLFVNKTFYKTCLYNLKNRRIKEYEIWKNKKIKYREEKNNWLDKRKKIN